MRLLIWGIGVLGAVWCLYWVAGSATLDAQVEAMLDSPQALTLSRQDVSVTGFPNRFDLTVTGPSVTDPATGIGWAAPFVQVFAMTWKPWHVIAALPGEQTITLPDQSVRVTSDRFRGSVQVTPDADLALQTVVIEADQLAITSTLGPRLRLERGVLSTAADPTRLNSHRIGLQVTNLAPPLVTPTDLPEIIARLHLDAHLLLSAALDRHAADTLPQLTGIEIADLSIDWGPMRVQASGSISATSDGTAQGVIDLRIGNWRLLPGALAALGAIKPEVAPTLLRAMELLAEGGADPAVLTLPLTFRNGRTSLGVLPLGPAPVIAYRQ